MNIKTQWPFHLKRVVRVIDEINHENKLTRLKALAVKFNDFKFHLENLEIHFTKIKIECLKCGGVFERNYHDIKRPKIKTLVCDCCGYRRRRPGLGEIKECLHCKEPIPHKKRNIYCSSKCSAEATKAETIRKWKAGELPPVKTVSNSVRDYIFEKFGYKCVECGCDKTNPYTGNSILQIEHKDGNPYNHSEDNLTLLCPNCHAQTPTYGALNKGNGREIRLRNNKLD